MVCKGGSMPVVRWMGAREGVGRWAGLGGGIAPDDALSIRSRARGGQPALCCAEPGGGVASLVLCLRCYSTVPFRVCGVTPLCPSGFVSLEGLLALRIFLGLSLRDPIPCHQLHH